MNYSPALIVVAIGSAGLLLSGCTITDEQSAPVQPVYVQPAPPPPPAPIYVRQEPPPPVYIEVREAPPPIIVERRPARPSERHVWIDGSWRWDGNRYDWSVGTWQMPPRENVIYVAPRYERAGDRYRYSPGRWDDDHRGNSGHDQDKSKGNDRRDDHNNNHR